MRKARNAEVHTRDTEEILQILSSGRENIRLGDNKREKPSLLRSSEASGDGGVPREQEAWHVAATIT
jgi:hypothetical protein